MGPIAGLRADPTSASTTAAFSPDIHIKLARAISFSSSQAIVLLFRPRSPGYFHPLSLLRKNTQRPRYPQKRHCNQGLLYFLVCADLFRLT